tara:strand:- start:289 stop:513 length:225 start_codon:yes stop_codon:yes gene_type:complete
MTRSTPKFTRRDFEFIADYIMPHMSWATGIEQVADELKRTNSNFNWDKFVDRATKNWEDEHLRGQENLNDDIPY